MGMSERRGMRAIVLGSIGYFLRWYSLRFSDILHKSLFRGSLLEPFLLDGKVLVTRRGAVDRAEDRLTVIVFGLRNGHDRLA